MGDHMIAGQSCYRLNNGPPVFVLPHRVILQDGTTRTDATQWFPVHGQSLGWAESTVTEQEAANYEAAQVEQIRSAKIAQLHQWWDSHPGIEVAEGIVLPIQEAGRNTNSGSFNLAFTLIGLGVSLEVIPLVNVRDRTVTIPVESALTAFNVFDTAYEPISQAWDNTMDALEAATNKEELDAVEIP